MNNTTHKQTQEFIKVDSDYWLACRFLWATMWRCGLIGLPIVFIVGIFGTFLWGSMGLDEKSIYKLNMLIINISSIPIGIFVIKRLLNKKFGKKNIIVIESDSDDQ